MTAVAFSDILGFGFGFGGCGIGLEGHGLGLGFGGCGLVNSTGENPFNFTDSAYRLWLAPMWGVKPSVN